MLIKISIFVAILFFCLGVKELLMKRKVSLTGCLLKKNCFFQRSLIRSGNYFYFFKDKQFLNDVIKKLGYLPKYKKLYNEIKKKL